ncbi:MAG: Gfo/Idh/MocA family oxidoreductase [Planctomycetes bacterium]|nr:Gfo/Idh/MocA family oxidoreductase [Planctomycetota bacterium]
MLKLGIIGLGMGLYHARQCAGLNDVRLLAISDMSEQRLQQTAEELNVEETYSDGYELIEKSDIDAVIIALPNHLHADFSIRAMKKGLHVLVEKPIASTIEEAEAMLAVSKECDKLLMVGYSHRFNPMYRCAHQYIKQGNLGNIYYAKANWLRRSGVPWWYEDGGKGALSSDRAGGGALIDIGIHMLDLAMFFMDFPQVESVDGTCFRGLSVEEGKKRGIDFVLEDAGVALIRMQDNRVLSLEASWAMHRKEADSREMIFYGEQGGMKIADEVEVYHSENGVESNTQLSFGDNYNEESITAHFCRVLQGQEEAIVTAEQGLYGLRILKAIYESAETGKAISFT